MLDSSKEKKVFDGLKPKVVVVGAGISGLIAGIKLLEEGMDVLILESEDKVGGRVYSEYVGDNIVNLGAQFFFKSDNNYLNYYIRKSDKFMPTAGYHGVLWDGDFITSRGLRLFNKLPISKEAHKDLKRALKKIQTDYKLLSKDREYIFDEIPHSDIWYELDKKSAAKYLEEFHEDVTNFVNCFLIPEGGTLSSETTALLLVSWFGNTGKELNYLVNGGNDQLPELIANDIKAHGGVINLSISVENITQSNDQVSIYCSNGEVIKSDYVIVTTPALVTKSIISDLPKGKIDALSNVKYGKVIQVGLELKDYYPKKKIGSSIFHNENINAYLSQTKKFKEGEAYISINITEDIVYGLDDDSILNYTLESLKKMQPNFDKTKHLKNWKVKKWENGIVVYNVGMLTKYQDDLRAPYERVFFAGDYTHNPALDGAAWSGIRSVEQIKKKIM